MKKSWQALMIIMALSIIFVNAPAALAQQDVVIAGGYGEASKTDPEVVAAASFAVRAKGRASGARITLLSIERAEVQVVAGLNYRLHMRVSARGETQNVTAVVYKNLRRQYALSSWEASGNQAEGNSALSFSTIEQLVDVLGVEFMNKRLGSLDGKRPYLEKVRIVIEHSLAADDDKDRFEIKDFKSLELAERWLTSREREDGTPIRETRDELRCRRGMCTIDLVGGIQHNHLYLKRVSYVLRRSRPYIKTIYLLDGD